MEERHQFICSNRKDYKRIKENDIISKALSLIEELNNKTLPYDKAVKIVDILS